MDNKKYKKELYTMRTSTYESIQTKSIEVKKWWTKIEYNNKIHGSGILRVEIAPQQAKLASQ